MRAALAACSCVAFVLGTGDAHARGRTPLPAPGAFRDVVLIGNDHGFHCSGVVIAPRTVLTARHCAPATRIAIGDSLADAVEVGVSDVVLHPTEDIALLTLPRDVAVAPHPRRAGSTEPITEIVIVGFGVEDPDRLTGFGTKRVRRTTPDGWGCDGKRAREVGCDPESELLLRGTRENDTCFGDSGGGAFERIGGDWQLIAVTSRSTAPRRAVCGEGGIYVRVDKVTAWIEQHRKVMP